MVKATKRSPRLILWTKSPATLAVHFQALGLKVRLQSDCDTWAVEGDGARLFLSRAYDDFKPGTFTMLPD